MKKRTKAMSANIMLLIHFVGELLQLLRKAVHLRPTTKKAMVYPSKPRIQSTYWPEERLSYNEQSIYCHNQLNKVLGINKEIKLSGGKYEVRQTQRVL